MLPELVVLTGLDPVVVGRTTRAMCRFDDTSAVTYDVRVAARGAVHRWSRRQATARVEVVPVPPTEVTRGVCEDLRRVIAELAADATVRRIVVALDPALEPGAVCRNLFGPAGADTTAARRVEVRGVLTILDEPSWTADATGSATLAERGIALGPDDLRTVAQVAVEQVECADAIVLTGHSDLSTAVRNGAVLDRLAPGVRRRRMSVDEDCGWMLDDRPGIGVAARTVTDRHGRLLRGEPSLAEEGGVGWLLFHSPLPMQPQRLHELVPDLLASSVRSRGRIWVAGRPDDVLWCESAGGGMRIEYVDRWLTAGDAAGWDIVDPHRRAFASLRWHPRFGDRAQDLAVLVHNGRTRHLAAGLRAALLTPAELALGPAAWRRWPDPFGAAHVDPCDALAQAGTSAPHMVHVER